MASYLLSAGINLPENIPDLLNSLKNKNYDVLISLQNYPLKPNFEQLFFDNFVDFDQIVKF